MLKIIARIMASFPALRMRSHPHAVRLWRQVPCHDLGGWGQTFKGRTYAVAATKPNATTLYKGQVYSYDIFHKNTIQDGNLFNKFCMFIQFINNEI